MLHHEGIDRNLRFLLSEVTAQFRRTREFLSDPNVDQVDRVLARDDYVDTLKNVIHRKCFLVASRLQSGDERELDWLDCVDAVSTNLERIADFCEDVVDQVVHMDQPELLAEFDFGPFLDAVQGGLDLVGQSVFDRSIDLALQICRAENELDALFAAGMEDCIDRLGSDRRAQSHVTVMFIFHYFERMGDSLQNVGEAVLSAGLGERIKIGQFRALNESIEDTDEVDIDALDLDLAPVSETRSGCRTSQVRSRARGAGRPVIFKEGRSKKLEAERDGIRRWEEVDPSLVPRILSFQRHKAHASVLLEYLRGTTFEEILLRGREEEAELAMSAIVETLVGVWGKTRVDEPVDGGFIGQLVTRLDGVYALHPELRQSDHEIGSMSVSSVESMVSRLPREPFLAPFRVLVHGDCNVDNLICDDQDPRVRFIDVHRSQMTDYLQDASVLIVSQLRLPGVGDEIRLRISRMSDRFENEIARFAESQGDTYYAARMALGLARSFMTSSRFVHDPRFASMLFNRGRYLLERIVDHGADLSCFELPREILRA